MSTKPTDTGRWANVSGDVVAPTSGRRDVGYEEGEQPPAPELNQLLMTAWEWHNWLDTVFDTAGGDLTIRDGNVIIEDELTLESDWHHGDRVLNISAYAAQLNANFTNPGSGYVSSTGVGALQLAIPLHVGDRIKSVTYYRSGDGSADIDTANVQVVDSTGTMTQLGITSENNPGAIDATTIDVTDHTLAAGEVLVFFLASNAANIRFYSLLVTYDRP